MHATAISSEFLNLKARLKKTWMAGDYDRFSRYMENGARDFYERLDAAPGAHFLDVACGSRQLALIAARDGLKVTGVDIARNPRPSSWLRETNTRRSRSMWGA